MGSHTQAGVVDVALHQSVKRQSGGYKAHPVGVTHAGGDELDTLHQPVTRQSGGYKAHPGGVSHAGGDGGGGITPACNKSERGLQGM